MTHQAHFSRPIVNRLRRFTAAWCAGLVVLLSILSVSPELHAWLHERPAAEFASANGAACRHAGCVGERTGSAIPADTGLHDDAGCAITLFAQGVPLLLSAPVLPAAERRVVAVVFRVRDAILIPTERWRCPPAHAPPQSLS
jgi:hypothetical protein